MDRELSDITKRKRKIRLIAFTGIGLLLLLVLIWGLRKAFESRLDPRQILTAVAETGPVESSVTATGEVIPEFEQVITSPIQANIDEVLKSAGSRVEPGNAILALDRSFALLDYEKLRQEKELKENGITKLRLELQKNSFDLQITDSIKALEILQMETELEDAKRLLQIGGGTQEEVDLKANKLKMARLEKRKLEFGLGIDRQQTETSIRELQLQSEIQGSSLKTMEEKLQRANVVASRSGVITWVNENLGTAVNEGDVLARIADLSRFKIVGTCSNAYAERIHAGMPVIVQLNGDERTEGTVSTVRPTVENNILTFEVKLDRPDHPQLRPNMRVEIYIITGSKQAAVRVANGPAFNGNPTQALFVIQGDWAVRRTVQVGLSNFDFVEIEQNIREGEEVIISDMTRYEHLTQLKINRP